MSATDRLIKMEHISIAFPGVKALDDVDFELLPGEVHVLLGENGAGKSTLMKILSGAYKKDEGEIWLNGERVEFANPRQAMDAGIVTIYQELNIIPKMTVAENIFLGIEPGKNGVLNWREINRQAEEVLKDVGVTIDPRMPAGDLGIAQQQMIEIAKAIHKKAKVVIMDEPTAALTTKEIDTLFAIIEDLKSRGIGIIYISHRMQELQEVGDRATVLRDGKIVGTVNFEEVSREKLISMMVGRDLDEQYPKARVEIGEEVLRVEGLSTADMLKDCSFSLRKGEILGIAGLMGAGRTELIRAVTGADQRSDGNIYVFGKKVNIKSFEDSVKLKIGFLTEDRKNQGLIQIMDVKENISMVKLDKVKKNGIINYKMESKMVQDLVDRVGVKTPDLKQKVKNLSGGNQQKVVLAKWLFADCDILIFDEPTRGIDVKAKMEIYQLMDELIKRGAAIIMISSELPEILGMSDRVLVMREGRIEKELDARTATQETILEYAVGGAS